MGRKAGRPRKEIDKATFEKLCGLQCTLIEIAGWFDCEEDTIEAWCKRTYDGQNFSEVFRRKRGSGQISLRRTQMKLAESSAAMAIFLGKQYLGQKDHPTYDEDMNKTLDRVAEVLGGVQSVIE